MELFLVRHPAVAVPPGTCYGQTDVPLKPGHETDAARLKEELGGEEFDAVFTSPLSRCRILAEESGYGHAMPESRIAELNFGQWEMHRFDEISDPRLQLWYDDWFNVAPTGGESCLQQQQRFSRFIEELRTRGYRKVLCFTHGGIIAHARVLAGLTTLSEAFAHPSPFASLIRICL